MRPTLRHSIWIVLLLMIFATAPAFAQITFDRLAQATYQVQSLANAREYYTGFLGIPEAFDLRSPTGEVTAAFFRLDPDQYLEFVINPAGPKSHFESISFLTKSLESLKKALRKQGLAPGETTTGPDGSLHATLKDNVGNTLDLMQYTPHSLQVTQRNAVVNARKVTPVTTHLLHVGLAEDGPVTALAFYHDKLGFTEFVRGGPYIGEVDWINLKIPGDSQDYIENMVHGDMSQGWYHICLEVPDIHAAYDLLVSRGMPARLKPFVAQNHRWIINLADTNGIRVEIMGENTDVPPKNPPKPRPAAEPAQ